MAKTAYHHGDLRAQLIAAVRELVETHGPDGFSIAEASRRAGVSSAAPYKHFKDKPEILRAVVLDAMERLRQNMEEGAAQYPRGSLEAVSAVGLAYIEFAVSEPGLFRLVFGLSGANDDATEFLEKGKRCFGVVVGATAAYLDRPADSDDVQELAYILWSFVHGHSFLTIDQKRKNLSPRPDDWSYLMSVGKGILGERPEGAEELD
ncbi:MAG: TetR/AcrR family transcriptional regulator [Pseudomonadota bacterium]